jgi:uncharacterized protein (TIGR00661 family)
MKNKNRILVAPLNWGLGHATRCIPIINKLIHEGFEPVIASDGVALKILQKEFPNLIFEELPSYNITYSKTSYFFKFKILSSAPKVLKTVKEEFKKTKKIVKQHDISVIISDNRLGVHHPKIKSIFITHQVNILSGLTTFISSKIHAEFIKKFDECWIPDFEGIQNLGGKLSHDFKISTKTKYIGPLSRFTKTLVEPNYDFLLLLSGPEPQRTLLETKLLNEFKDFEGNVIMVRGVFENEQKQSRFGKILVYNFMTSSQLEETINESKIIVSRSGYTTVMDLAKLGKKAFFIPTPGQTEQEYLAKKFDLEGIAPSCKQSDFKISELEKLENFIGFNQLDSVLSEDLFDVFRVKENSLPTAISLST